MKSVLFLTVLAMLASCSKSSSSGKGSLPSPDQQGRPSQGTDIFPLDPGQNQDQTQNDNRETSLTRTYEGTNLTLKPGKDSLGIVKLTSSDADFLYRKLRIKAVKVAEGKGSKDKMRIGKHVQCSTNSECLLNINYQNAEVLEQDNQGDRQKVLVLHSKSYKGDNLTVKGRSRQAIIELNGNDAKQLYQLIDLGAEDALGEDGSILKVKTGRGQSPLKCQVNKAPRPSDDSYNCTITLDSTTGTVEAIEEAVEE